MAKRNEEQDELLSLLQKLVSFPSVASNQQALQDLLAFAEKYFAIPQLRVEKSTFNGVTSLVVAPPNWSKNGVMLNAHIDVVPGNTEQFSLRVENDKAYGRGVYDMKGAAASFMYLMKNLAQTGKLGNNVALALVSDEEVGGQNGTKHLLEKEHIQPDFFLAGEPTNLNICNEQKGVLWLHLVEKGKKAHGSRPWEGKNANIALAQKIAAFYEKYPQPKKEIWETTYNLSILQGGQAQNVVPDTAQANFDIRRISTDSAGKILSQVQKNFPDTTVQVVLDEPCLFTEPNNPFISQLHEAVTEVTGSSAHFIKETFASDARFYSAAGVPSINFGPKGGNMHGDQEWLDIPSLVQFTKIMEIFLGQLQ